MQNPFARFSSGLSLPSRLASWGLAIAVVYGGNRYFERPGVERFSRAEQKEWNKDAKKKAKQSRAD